MLRSAGFKSAADILAVYDFEGDWNLEKIGHPVHVSGAAFDISLQNIGPQGGAMCRYSRNTTRIGENTHFLPLWSLYGYLAVPFSETWKWTGITSPVIYIAVEVSGKNKFYQRRMFHCRYLFEVNLITGESKCVDASYRALNSQYTRRISFKTGTWEVPMTLLQKRVLEAKIEDEKRAITKRERIAAERKKESEEKEKRAAARKVEEEREAIARESRGKAAALRNKPAAAPKPVAKSTVTTPKATAKAAAAASAAKPIAKAAAPSKKI